jgi:SARP family transcriptional regulator, regulator of embCAB operon
MKFGETLASPPLRIYLTGQVRIEAGGTLMGERQFPGRQGRMLFAYLAYERRRSVSRDELGEAVWPGEQPSAWEVALSALVSKLRRVLQSLGLPSGSATISSHGGCYHMHFPSDTWVDVEAAIHALDEAEGRLRLGDLQRAWGAANVVVAIARRPLLAGEEGIWVDVRRTKLQDLFVRGLDCLSEISLHTGEATLAIQYAAEAVAREPFRETGYQRLMRAHAALGNRAEALRVYERCRTLLIEEVGVKPSPEIEAVYMSLVRQTSPASP